MLRCQGSFKFHGEVNEVLCDFSHGLPFLLISAIENQNGVEVSITDVTEDGNREVVLITEFLKFPNGFQNLGHGYTKVLNQGNQLRSPSYFRERGDKALATRPHLQ